MRPRSSRALTKAAGTRAFLVSNPINIRYLTGMEISSGLLLATSSKWVLFVDGRYKEAVEKSSKSSVTVRDPDAIKSIFSRIKECGIESEHVTVARLGSWKRKFKNTKFVQKKGILEEFRRQKEPDELRAFRSAQRITQEMIRRVPRALRAGVTERSVAWKLQEWALELGAEGLSFDPIVAFGTHTSRPHHHPTNRTFSKGHIVQIDVGARYKGYCADQSMVFFTGKPTSLQQRVYDAVLDAKEAAMKAVCAGVETGDLDALAFDVLKEHGFAKYFCHALGHGVGLEVHEGVSLSSSGKSQKLLTNEIVTIEPGVYLPGKFGIRLEEEVIVSE